ncbi:signal recognition particle-docking protein FtsY [Candidatus Woesearchaeota archaeon]|nr:signal recognition particle-docking protein FtsY [Candidatus Woesearchaeota archaeon]
MARAPQVSPPETQPTHVKKQDEISVVPELTEKGIVALKEVRQENVEPAPQSYEFPVHMKQQERPVSETEEKKGFFTKIKETVAFKRLSEDKFEDIFFDLEVALLENNVAVAVIDKIKQDLKSRLVDQKLSRFEIENIILETLKTSLNEILSVIPVDLLGRIDEKRQQNQPYVIAFVGVNGSGKTTTIAKMAKYFQNNNLKPVLVAADTFRAAAIQQLEEHANRLGVKIIKHDYGSDPAAVAFDGIAYARAKNADVVLIDTAGRLHSNTNLMDEMKKIMRVANPDLKIFIGESITGNDCVEQAQEFNNAVVIDGIVLSKTDVDEKGGAAISVSYVTGKPILFFGSGQTYDSLLPFDKEAILRNLGLA